jgi:hypothetical protein
MKMKKLIFIIPVLFLFSCGEFDAPDADFRINPLTEPEAALRSLFFERMQDSIAFNEFGRPVVDTSKTARFGIRFVPAANQKDTVLVGFNEVATLNFDKDSLTPANAMITSLHLSFPGSQAYWKFGPKVNTREIKQIKMIIPNVVRAGSFRIQVGATIEQNRLDTSGIVKTVQAVVAEKNIILKLR